MKLEGKTVLLTGASRGIGRALAEEFEDRGARVLAGRRDDGPGVWIDLGSRETIDESCDALGEELRRVDVLVNNAGAFTGGQLESQDLDEIYNLFQVNLTGLVHLTRRVLPAMLERGSGKIVNHSSLVAYFRFPGISTYSASKAGVTAFTESLRRELRGTGVSTLEVVTGGVDTGMLQGAAGRLDGQADSSGWQWMSPDEWAKRIADAIESDRRVLQPPGRSRLGKELARGPAFVLDAISAKGFRRQ
jgi:short-subunit dehydrogenase